MPEKKAAAKKKLPAKGVSGKKALKKPAVKKATAFKKKAREKAVAEEVSRRSKPRNRSAIKKTARKPPALRKVASPKANGKAKGHVPAAEDLSSYLMENHPELFSDGEIVWEKLRLFLGDDSVNIGDAYNLAWAGKKDCIRLLQSPATKTLQPIPGESVDFESARNILIEGENLETLKILHKSLAGRVKMIYIDPPYNTGEDRIYKDDYSKSVDEYLRDSGQVDEEGNALIANLRTSGRFHSDWLSMMYPRLYVARTILSDDGVIFVSINDCEVYNLRILMNEVFGEENFIANIVWQKKQSPQNDAIYLSDMHDHILVYAKKAKTSRGDPTGWERILFPRGEKQDQRYSNPDNDPRGDWASVDYTCNKTADERPNLYYPINNPTTEKEVWPSKQRVWRFEKTTHARNETENRIWWGSDGKGFPRLKRFQTEVQAGLVPSTWWPRTEAGDNQEARRELRAMFPGFEDAFDTPKPVRLIKRLIQIASSPDGDDIILDFFGGSCPTGQAVLEKNIEDEGNRTFIMVQIAEPTGKDEFPSIAEVGKERLRKVLQKISDAGYTDTGGLRVFKVMPSTIKRWPGIATESVERYEQALEEHAEQLALGASEIDVAWDIAIREGFPLTSTVIAIPITKKYEALKFEDSESGRIIHIFLSNKTPNNIVDKLGLGEHDTLIVPDESITDEQATNIGLMCKLKVV